MIEPHDITIHSLPWVALYERKHLPDCAAIYFVLDGMTTLLYIGKTHSLAQRWISHDRLGQCRQIVGCRIAWFALDDATDLDQLEAACIAAFRPAWNRGYTRRTFRRTRPFTPAPRLPSTKITSEALRLLKQIAAHTGEKQYATLTRVLTKEWDRLQRGRRPKESDHA